MDWVITKVIRTSVCEAQWFTQLYVYSSVIEVYVQRSRVQFPAGGLDVTFFTTSPGWVSKWISFRNWNLLLTLLQLSSTDNECKCQLLVLNVIYVKHNCHNRPLALINFVHDYRIFIDYICSVERHNAVLVVLQIDCFDIVCKESIELLHVFPSFVVNPYKQKDYH